MKIGFVTAYSVQHPAGLERATLDLLKAVLTQDVNNEYLIYVKRGSGLGRFLSGYSHARVVEVGFGKFWKDIGLFFAPRADVYVFNGPQVPLVFSPRKYAVIAYDFGYRVFHAPGLRSYIKRMLLDVLARLAFSRARNILAISQYTKDELLRLFPVDSRKVQVMHLGFADVRSLRQKPVSGVPEKFFLFVGTLKERKNPLNVLHAFAQFSNTHPEYALVFAGKPSGESAYHQAMLKIIEREQLHNQVIFSGRVSEEQLAWLYTHARALVFPSFLEGFGFPILEAAHCGTPVITSNQGSLKEIAGDAALLVDPRNPDAIAHAMNRLAGDKELHADLVEKGMARASEFSWGKTAARFLEVLKNV